MVTEVEIYIYDKYLKKFPGPLTLGNTVFGPGLWGEAGHFTVFVRKENQYGLWLMALRKRIRNVSKNTTLELERLMGENKLLKTKNNLRTNFTDNW